MKKLGETKKIVLLGDGCIGKTTLFDKLNRLTDSNYQFQKRYNATENFDLSRLKINTGSGYIDIDLWDTAGQENYGGKLRDAYLKGADGVMLLYDITEIKTVENISKWLDQIKQITPNVPVAVLGNKSDKFNDIQQSDSVKIRECNLIRDVGHKKIKNFLISIKEDTHLLSESKWYQTIVKEMSGCLIGLEYILSNIFNQPIIIKY